MGSIDIVLVAELCVNHCGRVDLAERMIARAKAAGATAVKAQYFKVEEYMQPHDPLFDAVKKCELNIDQIAHLKRFAEQHRLGFLCTPFKEKARVDELESIGLEAYKIREADSRDHEFVRHVLSKDRPTYMSTTEHPDLALTPYGADIVYDPNMHFVYCIPAYPPEPSMMELYRLAWFEGISDHFPNGVAAIAACAVAAVSGQLSGPFYVEKHVTLSKQMDCLDNPVSVDFAQLERLAADLAVFKKFQATV